MPDERNAASPLEMWGGIECTLNRVGDRYFDQIAWSGHAERITDLDRIAELGIRRLRYPVLWERAHPTPVASPDWSWVAPRLARLRALGIDPIVGFLHHGSGPRHTNLLDPGFSAALARYAGRFARRFPRVRGYTPVNEPLTTARFSALYGHWYPHARDAPSFVRALLNQCRATSDAMREIRRVRPDAELIQTEDLGAIGSTAGIAYQADFENERRWITWDLLCGRVDRGHPLRAYLEENGASPAELDRFVHEPTPPQVIGVNHYVTSNRFLHERAEIFPPAVRGGNGRDHYADLAAVRVPEAPRFRLSDLLCETWERYRIPVAVTEAHLGCTREEQMRWLQEVWDEAREARARGADVRAVTAWALLGSFNWNSLVTEDAGYYEAGAFDVRGREPRLTAIGRVIRSLPGGSHPDLDLSAAPGWWRRGPRVAHSEAGTASQEMRVDPRTSAPSPGMGIVAREILIAGRGTLGTALAAACEERGLAHRLLGRRDLDIADPESVRRFFAEARPLGVVNAAGFVQVDAAESSPEKCYRENSRGAALLAGECAARAVPFVTFSSDLVFDGSRAVPYLESDTPAPLNVYGATKAEAERKVLAAHPGALVVRTSAFFGPADEANFVVAALQALASMREFRAFSDLIVSPTYVPDLAHATLDLLLDRAEGIWHLANPGALSWCAFALKAAEAAGVSPRTLRPVTFRCLPGVAPRPAYSALGSDRGLLLRPLDEALHAFAAAFPHRAAKRRSAAAR